MHPKHGRKVSHGFLGVIIIITAEGESPGVSRYFTSWHRYHFEKFWMCEMSTLSFPAAVGFSSMDSANFAPKLSRKLHIGTHVYTYNTQDAEAGRNSRFKSYVMS